MHFLLEFFFLTENIEEFGSCLTSVGIIKAIGNKNLSVHPMAWTEESLDELQLWCLRTLGSSLKTLCFQLGKKTLLPTVLFETENNKSFYWLCMLSIGLLVCIVWHVYGNILLVCENSDKMFVKALGIVLKPEGLSQILSMCYNHLAINTFMYETFELFKSCLGLFECGNW